MNTDRVSKHFFALAIACCSCAQCLATTLPVGPIGFNSNADYDQKFKEAPSLSGMRRDTGGYLSLMGSPTGLAVFDTSAIGGVNGIGGTSGSNANNDLRDFTISADLSSRYPGPLGITAPIGGGFLLRLNDSEAAGYAAVVHGVAPSAVVFDVFEGASFASAGNRIFTQQVSLVGVTLTPDTFYTFKVTLKGGKFQFDFASGAAQATFTDLTVSRTVGQVGVILDTPSFNAVARLDNFRIVPEPSAYVLGLMGLALLTPGVLCRSRK